MACYHTNRLRGLRVLVTRPQHQAQYFIEQIASCGGLPFHLPTIEITYTGQGSLLDNSTANLFIFTSVNAVIGAQLGTIHGVQKQSQRAATPLVAAIGAATTNALRQAGIQSIIAPASNSNSETLLEILKPHINPKMEIVIVRGDSGRDLLRDKLTRLGARVRYEAVYQRKLPAKDPSEISKYWKQADPDIVSISSDLGLVNLIKLLPLCLQQQLFAKPLVVNSTRCLKQAQAAGFSSTIRVALPPGDQGQITQLISHAQTI